MHENTKLVKLVNLTRLAVSRTVSVRKTRRHNPRISDEFDGCAGFFELGLGLGGVVLAGLF